MANRRKQTVKCDDDEQNKTSFVVVSALLQSFALEIEGFVIGKSCR